MKAILIFFLFISLTSCDAVNGWLDYINPPEPIEQDTVCTTYTPITQPAFITAYMIQDAYQGDRILNVYPYIDTIHEGEDIQIALDSMVGLLYPQYSRKVYVNDENDLLHSVILKGTNDKNKLLGKLWIRYNGYRHYYGCEPQSMIVVGSQTESEFNENLIEFPSFDLINWMNTNWDSTSYIKSIGIALDTAHCKGGRYWFDMRFNPFTPLPVFVNYAIVSGWDNALTNFGGTHIPNIGKTITLNYRASNLEIMDYLNQGYCVKVKE